MNPSFILTWIIGILLATIVGTGSWLNLKIICVFLISAFHMYCAKVRNRFEMTTNTNSEKFYRYLNEIPTVLFVIIVALAIFKPEIWQTDEINLLIILSPYNKKMHLKDLKSKNPQELLKIAEDLEIENAGTLRKQDMIFAILKQMAMNNDAIYGEGVLEILQDGFGFLRSPDANYLPGPDDIYVSPGQIKKNSLRTGDTVEGEMRAPRESEWYFAITKIDKINF